MDTISSEISDGSFWSGAYQALACSSDYNSFENCYGERIVAACADDFPSCSFIQFLSKCLKSGRSSSHPERDIGRAAHPKVQVDRGQCARRAADFVASSAGPLLLRLMQRAASVPGYYAYFILILLKDVLKEIRSKSSDFPLVGAAAASLNLFAAHYSYSPVAVKLMDVSRILIEESTLLHCSQSESVLILASVIQSYALIFSAVRLRTTDEVICDCRLLSREGPSARKAAAELSMAAMGLLSRAAAIALYPDVEIEQKEGILQILIAADKLLCDIYSDHNLWDVLTELSDDDSALLLFLLDTLEVLLRLNFIITAHDSVSPYKSLLENFRRHELDPVLMFEWLITVALCLDMSVLVDLISGSETVALKYTLRIVSYLKSHCLKGLYANESQLQRSLQELSALLYKLNKKRVLPFDATYLIESIDCILTSANLLDQRGIVVDILVIKT